MSLSSISGDSAALSALQQRRNALKQLDADAESGNFAAAQNDLAAFQQLSPSQAASAAPAAAVSASVTTLQSDLSSLLNAALGGASSSSLQSSATAVENDLTGFAASGSSSSTNPLNTLLDAAQSGDAASAKQAAQTLIQDLQGAQGAAGAHHGHHHHGGAGSDDLTPTAEQLIDPTASASPTQSVAGLPQALLDALDTAAATNPNAMTGGTTSSGG